MSPIKSRHNIVETLLFQVTDCWAAGISSSEYLRMDVPHEEDDELAVTVPELFSTAELAAVELPLAVNPTEEGTQAALALVGGIEELSSVTADEV